MLRKRRGMSVYQDDIPMNNLRLRFALSIAIVVGDVRLGEEKKGQMANRLRLLRATCVALPLFTGSVGCRDSAPPPVPELSQPTAGRVGWSAAERSEFYHLDEGSEVFPLTWFLSLESESGSGLFAANLQRFGFIPDPVGPSNPHGLPVGITAAQTRDLRFAGVEMVGVNCAACHVNEMVINGTAVRLDGAGGRANISAFYGGLATTTVATVRSPMKFLAFLDRLRSRETSTLLPAPEAARSASAFRALPDGGLTKSPSAFDAQLQTALVTAIEAEMKLPTQEIPGSLTLKPGAGQVSAAAAVRAAMSRELTGSAVARRLPTVTGEASILATGDPDVRASAAAIFTDALTTLRLLKARVAFIVRLAEQAGGETTPPGFGRIDAFGGARNLLFDGHRRPTTAPVSYPHLWNFERISWLHWDANTTSVLERNIGQSLGLGAVLDRATFASTVSVLNLHRLEQLAKQIKPPRWAEVAGPVDEGRAAQGAELFRAHCASCHASETESELDVILTDRKRAENFAEPVGTVANNEAIADLVAKIKVRAFDDKGLSSEQRAILNGREAVWRVTRKYAGRPLVAPWATAPFLHNNSVPTLADLLLPPEQRPPQFFVGSSQFDSDKLGIITADGPGHFNFDTKQPGNSNAGHNFGTGLSPTERRNLLEYLKKF